MKGLWIQGIMYLPSSSPIMARPNSKAKLGKLILTSIWKYFCNVQFNLILHL